MKIEKLRPDSKRSNQQISKRKRGDKAKFR